MAVSLESVRFAPNTESLDYMHALRDTLPIVQFRHPEVAGLGFFESRVLGRERIDQNNPSDLDMVVFYDGTRFHLPIVDMMDFNSLLRQAPKITDLQDEKNRFENKLEDFYADVVKQAGLPADNYTDHGKRSVLVTDISEESTDRLIQSFVDDVNNDRYIDRYSETSASPSIPTLYLTSRFFLAIGEPVYTNRTYILDRFEELDQKGGFGSYYFNSLMQSLHFIERELRRQTPFNKLPKTITDARRFFITNQ